MLYNEHIHVHCINSEINIYMPIVKELDIDKTQEKFTILEFHLRPSRCLNSWLHSNKFFVYIKFLYYGQVYVNLRVIAKFVIILCINIYNYIYICNVYRSSHSVVLPYSTLISNVPVVGCRLVGSVLHQKQDILSCLNGGVVSALAAHG